MICWCKKEIDKGEIRVGSKASPDGDFMKKRWFTGCADCVKEMSAKSFDELVALSSNLTP